MRLLTPLDYGFCASLMADPETGLRWRFRGTRLVAGPVTEDSIWADAHIQYVLANRESGDPLSLATAYAADSRTRTIYAAVATRKECRGQGFGTLALALLVWRLFETDGFERILLDFPEYNLVQFPGLLEEQFECQATLTDYYYFGGSLWSRLVYALDRDSVDPSILALVGDFVRVERPFDALIYAQ